MLRVPPFSSPLHTGCSPHVFLLGTLSSCAPFLGFYKPVQVPTTAFSHITTFFSLSLSPLLAYTSNERWVFNARGALLLM